MDKYELETIALKTLFSRYKSIIEENKTQIENCVINYRLQSKCHYDSLLNLVNEAISNTNNYPFDKMHRWLGFTQGVLSVMGLIDVDEERDFTRPHLHSYHDEKPKTF